MERLCAAYWYPLYAFLRRQGMDEQAAKDMTQEFFVQRVVTRRVFRGIDPAQGKFRSWLLASLRNLLANQMDRQNAVKRGGGFEHVSLDMESAEDRYRLQSNHNDTPERIYDYAWATTLLHQAREQLRLRYEKEGKAELFQQLVSFLPGEQSGQSRAQAAVRLGRNENAVNVAIHRLRSQFGEILRCEVDRTVSHPSEVGEELRHLIQVVGG